RCAKIGMVQQIESFHPQLKLMTLVVGHLEVFVYFSVDGEDSRSNRRVSSYVAELAERSFHERGPVIPAVRVRIVDLRTDAHRIRPIVRALSERVVDSADRDCLRNAALKR